MLELRTKRPWWKQPAVIRGVAYAIPVLVAGAFLIFADLEAIQRNFFQLDILQDMLPEVITIAARNTLIATFLSFGMGLLLALGLALMKRSPIAPYRWFATGYIELFRGVPALVTIILIGFGIPIAFDVRIPAIGCREIGQQDCLNILPGSLEIPQPLVAGSVGLAIVAAAYMAETIRAGIEAVPSGQIEAARSLGMSSWGAMRSIVLPQAFRIIIPPLTNEFVLLIKDTSLFFVLGTTPASKELTKFARDFMTETRNATPLTVAALTYLVITLPLTALVRRLEKSAARGKR
jgi:polar amino acid transport system permease protein